MKTERVTTLIEKFPSLFGKNKFRFVFNCEDGWYDLIYNLADAILKVDPNSSIIKVRENDGKLKIRCSSTDPNVTALVNACEETALQTCELCGSRGTLTFKNKSLKTLCKKCRKELGYGVPRN